MAARPRIAVIGGGITGAFAALFAAQAGAEVTVVERDAELRNASTQNPGGLNPVHGVPPGSRLAHLALASFELHRQLWPRLRLVGAADFGGRVTRRLHVALDDKAAEQLRTDVALYTGLAGFDATWREPAEARSIETRLCAGGFGALDVTGNLRVDPLRYTEAVMQAAVAGGAACVRAEATGIVAVGETVTAVRTAASDVACDAIVLATGPWVAAASRWFGVDIAVGPVRGEMLLVAGPEPPLAVEVSNGMFGVYPNSDGTTWLGGTEDAVGYDDEPTGEGRAHILDGVGRLIGGLDACAVLRHTAALRPVSADGLPLAGRLPGWSNVAVALGGGRKGMLLSAGLGQSAVELLLDGATLLPVSGFETDRVMATA